MNLYAYIILFIIYLLYMNHMHICATLTSENKIVLFTQNV